MKLLFVADAVHTFAPYKDTTYAMMREANRRGMAIHVCQPHHVHWQSGQGVQAWVQRLTLLDVPTPSKNQPNWYALGDTQCLALSAYDAVLMRKDPPFDSEYFYATHLLEQAAREGAKIFNRPQALRDHSEKLALMEFAQWAPPTLVTRDAQAIRGFHEAHQDIILKPLDGMGGMGIFRVKPDGLNLGSIIEQLGHNGQQTLMVQQYQPAIAQGDKRVLLIAGEPVPYALARMPQAGEVRGNLAAGGRGVAQPLAEADLAIARALGPTLGARGLLLVGLDVIGEKLTEVNVTSPTCFREITEQTGWDVASHFIDALQAACAASS
ncbi:MAG: glutathione synthase [Burkholderiaceae bacterium]